MPKVPLTPFDRRVMGAVKTAIYDPPTKDFPYVVVTMTGDDYELNWAKTLAEAREIAIAKRRPKQNR